MAGPFHPAYRELVENEIYYDFFKEILARDGKLEIFANERDVSKYIGINRKNKIRLGKEFHLKIDGTIERNSVIVNDKKYTRAEILKGELHTK